MILRALTRDVPYVSGSVRPSLFLRLPGANGIGVSTALMFHPREHFENLEVRPLGTPDCWTIWDDHTIRVSPTPDRDYGVQVSVPGIPQAAPSVARPSWSAPSDEQPDFAVERFDRR